MVASNVIDAIPVLTCAGKVDVIHWLEEDDEDAITTPLYWRQTFNGENNKLSVGGAPGQFGPQDTNLIREYDYTVSAINPTVLTQRCSVVRIPRAIYGYIPSVY